MSQKTITLGCLLLFVLESISFSVGAESQKDTIIPKISGISEVCVGGDSAVLKATPIYTEAEYQWFKNGELIEGATSTAIKHTSEIPQSNQPHTSMK